MIVNTMYDGDKYYSNNKINNNKNNDNLSRTWTSWSHYYSFEGSLMDVLGSFVLLVGTS